MAAAPALPSILAVEPSAGTSLASGLSVASQAVVCTRAAHQATLVAMLVACMTESAEKGLGLELVCMRECQQVRHTKLGLALELVCTTVSAAAALAWNRSQEACSLLALVLSGPGAALGRHRTLVLPALEQHMRLLVQCCTTLVLVQCYIVGHCMTLQVGW